MKKPQTMNRTRDHQRVGKDSAGRYCCARTTPRCMNLGNYGPAAFVLERCKILVNKGGWICLECGRVRLGGGFTVTIVVPAFFPKEQQ